MSDERPHLLDLEDDLYRLEGLSSAIYWLGRGNENPDRVAVRTIGECLEEAAATLRRKWERLHAAQRVHS